MLFTRDTCIEISVFMVIVWYTYRNKDSLKFSALVRAIIAQATIYFLVIAGVQIYLQVALPFRTVRSSINSPCCAVTKLEAWFIQEEDLFGSSTT